MKTEFWLLDVSYQVEEGKPEVWLWGIDGTGNGVLLIDRNFLAYFYAVVEDKANPHDVMKKINACRAELSSISKVEVVKKRFFGRPVNAIKIFCQDPEVIPKYAKRISKVGGVKECLEDDMRYSMRYLIDNNIVPCGWHEVEVEEIVNDVGARVDKVYVVRSPLRYLSERQDVPSLKVLSFFMVCYDPRGSPKPDRSPVVVISIMTSSGEEEQFIADGLDDKLVIKAFVDYIRRFDPDVIVGYGTNQRDWPYLMARSKAVSVPLSVDRAGVEPHTSVYGHVSITGRANVDLYDFAEDLTEVKVKTLENVADYLGVMKLEGRKIIEDVDYPAYWESSERRPELLNFCRESARCVMGIANAMLDFAIQLSNLVGLPLDHVGTAAVGFRVEWFLIREAYKIGELVPKRIERPYIPYVGAVVLEPRPGIHENVAILDFRALYPSVMISHNVSPDTYISPAEPEPPCGVNVAPEVGHKFRAEPPGLYKEVLSHLIAVRDEVRSKLKELNPKSVEYRILDARQRALKVITNATYGYCFDYDEPILLYHNGKVELEKIGNFIEDVLEDKIKLSEYKVFALNPENLRLEPCDIINVWRHESEEDLIEVTLEDGTYVRMHGEHPFWIFNDGKLIEKRAKDLHIGEWIPVPKVIPSPENHVTSLNLIETLRKLDYKRQARIFVENIDVSESTPYKYRRYRRLPLAAYKSESSCDQTTLRQFFAERRLPLCLPLNEETMFIFGAYEAEGYYNPKDDIILTLGLHETAFSQKLIDIIKRSFDPEPHVISTNNETYVHFGGQITSWLFESLGFKNQAHLKNIPTFIFNTNSEGKIAFLKGYFGDAHVRKREIIYSTSSRSLAFDLLYLLRQLGISASVRLAEKPKLTKIQGRKYTRRGKYDVRIGLAVDTVKALTLIPEHLSKQDLIKERSRGSDFICLPRGPLQLDKLYKISKPKWNRRVYDFVRRGEFKHPRGIQALISYIYKTGNLIQEVQAFIMNIQKILNGDVMFRRIKKIAKVKATSKYLYDVRTQYANFIGGHGPIILHNCGWIGARWYIKPVAEATTAWGRHAIMNTIKLAEKIGLKVIYGDTDSIFIKYDLGKVEEISAEISKVLGLEIKPDKVYVRVLFTEAKKKYCGLLKDGKLDIVGLEVIRGDWAMVAKNAQEKVLEIILRDLSPRKAVEFIHQYVRDLRGRKLPYKDFIIWKTLTKSLDEYAVRAPHVEAAKMLKERGWELGLGDKIGYVVIAKPGRVYERVKPYVFASYDEIDVEYYVSNQVVPAVSRILSIFGVKEEDLLPTAPSRLLL